MHRHTHKHTTVYLAAHIIPSVSGNQWSNQALVLTTQSRCVRLNNINDQNNVRPSITHCVCLGYTTYCEYIWDREAIGVQ